MREEQSNKGMSRRDFVNMVTASAVAAGAAGFIDSAKAESAAKEEIIIDRDIWVPMRDSVLLATDIYRPSDNEKHPILVHRLPYDKSYAWIAAGLMFNPLEAVERGYVVVIQDTRGRHNSEGVWNPFFHEAEDGYDTVEWAASQPWSDGNVGIYGSSYMGVTTWQTVITNPPHLKAAIAYLTGSNYHNGWTYSGGAFELGFNLWWTWFLAGDTLMRLKLSPDELNQALAEWDKLNTGFIEAAKYLPLKNQPAFQKGVATYWREWLEHPSYDGYWEKIDINKRASNIKVPVLHITGWYDNFLRGHLDIYKSIKEKAAKDVQESMRFIIGPWDHGAYLSLNLTSAGERSFGAQAFSGPFFVRDLGYQWFDSFLKGEKTGANKLPRVRYFDLGKRNWQESEEWPPKHTLTRFYFHSQGKANTRFGDGELSTIAPEQELPNSYVYDPVNPVPSRGGRTLMPTYGPGGIQDQSKVEERDDVLIYTSPQLASSVSVAGPVKVTLYASSSAPDTDFTAKLVDVEPDGYCANVAEGIVRARYRNSMAKEDFMEPGKTYEFKIDLWDVAYTFAPGHRIRVEISSSNFPRYDRNLNTNKPMAEAAESDMKVATQRVFHNTDYPSHIVLPVVG